MTNQAPKTKVALKVIPNVNFADSDFTLQTSFTYTVEISTRDAFSVTAEISALIKNTMSITTLWLPISIRIISFAWNRIA
jgi:hypothetical protein